MRTQTMRPGSLVKLHAMLNDLPREAEVNQPAAQLEGLELGWTALEDRLKRSQNKDAESMHLP